MLRYLLLGGSSSKPLPKGLGEDATAVDCFKSFCTFPITLIHCGVRYMMDYFFAFLGDLRANLHDARVAFFLGLIANVFNIELSFGVSPLCKGW